MMIVSWVLMTDDDVLDTVTNAAFINVVLVRYEQMSATTTFEDLILDFFYKRSTSKGSPTRFLNELSLQIFLASLFLSFLLINLGFDGSLEGVAVPGKVLPAGEFAFFLLLCRASP